MYILYLDDSGSVFNKHEDYLVLGGVCVHESAIHWLSEQLEVIASTIHAAELRLVEFHAAAIFGGREGFWKQMPDRLHRIETIKRVLRVLDSARSFPPITLFACAVHKPSFPDHDPVELAFEDLTSRFSFFLQRASNLEKHPYSHKGMLVLDKSTYEENLQNMVLKFRKEGNQWGNNLRNLCEVPLFVDSKSSRIIQLADHVAYSVFRRYNANDLTYYNCIESKFDRSESTGVIYGLTHKQLYNRHCTCPACITRRLQVREIANPYNG